MFGLSIGKILLILVAVVVLLLGSRIFRQLKSNSGDFSSPDAGRSRGGPTGSSEPPASGSAADLIQCRACGAFAAGNCGKPGCPLA
ncbi:MAG: hypothetical protein OXF89_19610 [Rhodospirillaceae bacterium]|nr:hypothetical protein [Rhodospirillaceae bacterium]MCY4067173.1 hypothetical protein [Rhodospirillaceae bacterium]